MVNEKLNVVLADYVVLHQKLQNLHWYVKGEAFFRAHEKLEEYYDMADEAVDEVAELILMNGGAPLASLAEYLGVSGISERADAYLYAPEALAIVKADFETLYADIKAAKAAADSEDNYLVSAALDGYIADLAKALWMISQTQM